MTTTNGGVAPIAVRVDWYRPTSINGLQKLAQLPEVKKRVRLILPASMRQEGDPFLQAMVTECSANPALLDCAPISLFACAVRAAQIGLKIGGPAGEAFMLPFNNKRKGYKEAVLVIGYKGFIQLALRSGMVRRLTTVTVRDGDEFGYSRGTSQQIRHEPKLDGGEDRRAKAFYAVVELANGGTDFEVFSYDDAKRHRDRFATVRNAPPAVRDNSPWYDDSTGGGFERMAEKTMARRLAKRIPLSPNWSEAAVLDDQAERGEPQNFAEIESALVGETPPPEEKTVEYAEDDPLHPDDPANGGK